MFKQFSRHLLIQADILSVCHYQTLLRQSASNTGQICVRQERSAVTSTQSKVTSNTHAQGEDDNVSAKPYKDIPGPHSFPFIGGFYHSLPGGQFHGMQPHEIHDLCQSRYGSIFKEVIVPGLEYLHVFDPVDIEVVYRNDSETPVRNAFFTLSYFNKKYKKQQGLLTSQGKEWQRIRKNVQQKMLRPKAVAAYLPEQLIVAEELLHRVIKLRNDQSEVDDLRPEFDKYAAECVGVVCFNKRLQAFDESTDSEAANFIRAVDTIMYMSILEFKQLPWFRLFRTTQFTKFVEAQSFIRELATKYTTEYLSSMKDSEEFDGEHGDLIPYLLSKTDLTTEDVLTVVSEFIFAGVDTTSHHLSFMMYLLGRNPEAQEKVYEEIQNIVPADNKFTSSTLGKMSYMKAVTKEIHRLLPVTAGNIRTSTKDMVLSGYNVPSGTNIALHHKWISTQDSFYPDAASFRPERWIRGHEIEHDAHPFATLPFGYGVRSCIGRRLAEQEAQIAVIKILQNFHVEYTGDPLKIEQSITIMPATKMRFRLTSRSSKS